jgi:ABC-type transport system substrate-binding protein
MEIEGDLAESFELSNDRMQVTLKLRSGMHWDLPSKREIDSQDFLFSWNKFTKVSAYRSFMSREASPDGPIESVSAPDAKTVVIKLASPDPAIMTLLASNNMFIVMPRESDGGFDPKTEIRGYGPWLFDSYQPSLGLAFKRTPTTTFATAPSLTASRSTSSRSTRPGSPSSAPARSGPAFRTRTT